MYVHTPLLGSSFYGRMILQIPNVEYPKWEMEGRHYILDRELTVERSSRIWGDGGGLVWFEVF